MMVESIVSILGWLLTAVIGALCFLYGKAHGQSEKILDAKRKSYEDFLKFCPAPNEAHERDEPNSVDVQRSLGILSLYGSTDVLKYASEYFIVFAGAQQKLRDVAAPLHPEWRKVATSYNKMVWAMRVDATARSFFAPSRSAREYRPTLLGGNE